MIAGVGLASPFLDLTRHSAHSCLGELAGNADIAVGLTRARQTGEVPTISRLGGVTPTLTSPEINVVACNLSDEL
jgi:hypothetical protein